MRDTIDLVAWAWTDGSPKPAPSVLGENEKSRLADLPIPDASFMHVPISVSRMCSCLRSSIPVAAAYVALGMMADFIISALWSGVAQECFSLVIFFRTASIKWEALVFHSRESEMCTPRYLYVARGGRQGYVASPLSGCVYLIRAYCASYNS